MRVPLPAIVSPADVSSTFGRESCNHVPMHLDAFIGGGGEKGVFDRGRPWQGGHGQWLGGLGSDAPCVGGSDLRGQRQAGRGSWVVGVGRGSGSWGTLVLGGEEDPGI